MARQQENNQPVFGHYWAPTGLMGSYEWQILEEPPHTNECSERLTAAAQDPSLRPVDAACAYENVPIDKLAHRGLLSKASDLADMLRKMNVGLEPLNTTLAWATGNEVDDPKTIAIYYLQNFEDRWSTWVTPQAYKEIKGVLDAAAVPQY